MKILATEELKEHILKKMTPLGNVNLGGVFFKNITWGNADGLYIFTDKKGYNFIYLERGEKIEHRVATNLFQIAYWFADDITISIASAESARTTKEGENQRENMFRIQLQFMSRVGKEYEDECKREIEKTLKKYPF